MKNIKENKDVVDKFNEIISYAKNSEEYNIEDLANELISFVVWIGEGDKAIEYLQNELIGKDFFEEEEKEPEDYKLNEVEDEQEEEKPKKKLLKDNQVYDEDEVIELFKASYRDSGEFDKLINEKDEITNADLVEGWKEYYTNSYEPLTEEPKKEMDRINEFINEYEDYHIKHGSIDEII